MSKHVAGYATLLSRDILLSDELRGLERNDAVCAETEAAGVVHLAVHRASGRAR